MKRLVVGGLIVVALLLLGASVLGCASQQDREAQREVSNYSHLVGKTLYRDVKLCISTAWGPEDTRAFVWYGVPDRPTSDEKRSEIEELGCEELWRLSSFALKEKGSSRYETLVFQESYQGIYRHFVDMQNIGEWFEIRLKVTVVWDEGAVIRGDLLEIYQGDRSWTDNGQWLLGRIGWLETHLKENYQWQSKDRADTAAGNFELAKFSLYQGLGTRAAEQEVGKAMEQLFQDALSGSEVSVFFAPGLSCSEPAYDFRRSCTIEEQTPDGALRLDLVGDADEVVAALRAIPIVAKDLIGRVEVLSIKDAELGVTWGWTSYLGFQDKFGNWYILVS